MLLFTMLLTGLGSLYNALAPDYTNFVLARVVTGIGVGAAWRSSTPTWAR
jgi:putative MFS transporter